jgi:hypothetical protein
VEFKQRLKRNEDERPGSVKSDIESLDVIWNMARNPVWLEWKSTGSDDSGWSLTSRRSSTIMVGVMVLMVIMVAGVVVINRSEQEGRFCHSQPVAIRQRSERLRANWKEKQKSKRAISWQKATCLPMCFSFQDWSLATYHYLLECCICNLESKLPPNQAALTAVFLVSFFPDQLLRKLTRRKGRKNGFLPWQTISKHVTWGHFLILWVRDPRAREISYNLLEYNLLEYIHVCAQYSFYSYI